MSVVKYKPSSECAKAARAAERIKLGKRIAQLRMQAGCPTQGDLADRLPGIDRNHISNWEIGHSAPDIFIIPALCRALNCTYAQFFGESIFYAEKDISKFAAITKLNEENLQKCLAFADFLEAQQRLESTDKK